MFIYQIRQINQNSFREFSSDLCLSNLENVIIPLFLFPFSILYSLDLIFLYHFQYFWKARAPSPLQNSFLCNFFFLFFFSSVIMAPPSGINATVIDAKEIEVRWGPPYNDKVCPCAYFCVQLQYASRITNTWHTALVSQFRHLSKMHDKTLILNDIITYFIYNKPMRAENNTTPL